MPAEGLYPALLAVQAELPTLPKDATNPHFRSKFTSLDTIVEKVGPVLQKHGLVWQTFPTVTEAGAPALRYKITHAPTGQSDQDTMPLLIAKADPQGQGSGITYARRYAIQAVLNLVADEDDDGNAASRTTVNQAVEVIRGQQNIKPKPTAKTLTPTQVERLDTRLGTLNADPRKVQLALNALGVSDLNELTADQAKALVAKVTA